MAETPHVSTLVVFFLGVALCLWRAPQADRRHVILCLIAAGLWCVLLIVDPGTRKPGFGFTTATFLFIGLSQPFRRRAESRFHR